MTTPSPPSAAAHATVVRGSAVWVPPGSPPVTVGDYVITGGLVYLGTAVPAAYAAMYEPALIDPKAPVRRVRLDQESPAEDVRPVYAELTPGARAAYLEWLAAGRKGPTPTAHLWLFLYGLERRVLVDLAGTLGTQQEYTAIAAEITEVADRYPNATAFVAQVAEFTDLLDSLIGLNDPGLQPPPTGPRTGELPLRLRVGIGRYVAHGLPVSAEWAYAWYAYSAYRHWGPAATRRPDEFRRAFATRYAEAYPGGGIFVPAPETDVVLDYHPASPGFADRTVRIHTRLPDISDLTQPLEAFTALAGLAEADLAGAERAASPLAAPPPAGSSATEPTPSAPWLEPASRVAPRASTTSADSTEMPGSGATAQPEMPLTGTAQGAPPTAVEPPPAAPLRVEQATAPPPFPEPEPAQPVIDQPTTVQQEPAAAYQIPDPAPVPAPEPAAPGQPAGPDAATRPGPAGPEPSAAKYTRIPWPGRLPSPERGPAHPPRTRPEGSTTVPPPAAGTVPPPAAATVPPPAAGTVPQPAAGTVPPPAAATVPPPAAGTVPLAEPSGGAFADPFSQQPGRPFAEPVTEPVNRPGEWAGEDPARPYVSDAEPAGAPGGDMPHAGHAGTHAAGRRVTLDGRPHLAAAEALLRLVTLTGIADGYVRAVRRHVVDALALSVTERQRLDDRLDRYAYRRPAAAVVRQRFETLNEDQQRTVTDLLIAAAGADGVLEPGQAAVLAAVFELLGYGAAELHRRLEDLEVAAVVDESTIDTTVLDEDMIRDILAGALTSAAMVDALVSPSPRYATCP